MSRQRVVKFFLDDGMRQSALAGKHNFITRLAGALQTSGYRVEFCRENSAAGTQDGFSMFHMDGPMHDRALIFRRVYHYPFWAIEPSPKRWDWHVARTRFPSRDVLRKEADQFYQFWQKRLFGTAPDHSTRDGFVFVPLQGRLLDHRSFQICSPLEMLRAVLQHEKDRDIVATLHPKERYSALELAELDSLEQHHKRLSVRTGGAEPLLASCDYIVTQNSGVAFDGMFFGKPAVLFGQIDFHHILANVAELGAAQAIRQAPTLTPDYAGYLHWFWQIMSINAGRVEAEQQIQAALIRAGWPM